MCVCVPLLRDALRYAIMLVRGFSRSGKTELAKSWFRAPCAMAVGKQYQLACRWPSPPSLAELRMNVSLSLAFLESPGIVMVVL